MHKNNLIILEPANSYKKNNVNNQQTTPAYKHIISKKAASIRKRFDYRILQHSSIDEKWSVTHRHCSIVSTTGFLSVLRDIPIDGCYQNAKRFSMTSLLRKLGNCGLFLIPCPNVCRGMTSSLRSVKKRHHHRPYGNELYQRSEDTLSVVGQANLQSEPASVMAGEKL